MARQCEAIEPGQFAYGATVLDRHADTPSDRASFARVRRAENSYARHLRSIARHVGTIVRGFTPLDATQLGTLQRSLGQYAAAITPWATTTATRMLADVARRDEGVWASLTEELGRSVREEIANAPTGELMRRRLDDQVRLITSLPIEAGERVHQLTLAGLSAGTRASEYVDAILRSGDVTVSRANLIARTETSRTASALVMARAVHVGSDGYVWRTARDQRVRKIHRKLEGKFIDWDDPPVAGERGERAHAGEIYNCRCYPEPVLPREFRH